MSVRGFTVLELVVALTLAGAALTAGYAALSIVTDRRSVAAAILDSALAEAGVRRELAALLAGAHLRPDVPGAAFQGRDGSHEELPDDDLRFTTTASSAEAAGGAWVHLYIDRDDRTTESGLVASFGTSRDAGQTRHVLVPGARGLDLRYRSEALAGVSWLPSWTSATLLPAGVEITLTPAPGDSLSPLLRLPIVAPIAVGR